MLNTTIHKKEMIKLFLDILSNRNLSTTLGFKGGTALYLFYDLDRFSTDLDFNMIDEDFSTDEMTLEIEKSLNISKLPKDSYLLLSVKPNNLHKYLAACDVGLLFREKDIINWVSRPTKMLEYQSVGLKIEHNNTIAWLANQSQN